MSNAAVINATSTSGQTAGTPISIETGGDVVLKAYGTGSGNWFVVMAFAPVVNGVTGAPVTLTIDYNQPGRQTSAVGTSATEWVGWVLDQGGTWEASGIVEGYQPGESLSDDLGTFASFDALPQYGVKIGARASVNGVQYTYGAAGWVGGASALSASPASGDFVGQLIWVVNPAVPRGRSRLEWTGSIWAPPAGELIAAVWRGAAPVALVTPGVIGQVEIFGATGNLSKIIPGYMIPAGLLMKIQGGISIRNAAGGTENAQVRLGVSSVALSQSQAPLWRSITPAADFAGIGQSWSGRPVTIDYAYVTRRVEESTFASPVNTGAFPGNTCGTFSENATRLRAYATTTSVTDQIQFDGCKLTSEGNL